LINWLCRPEHIPVAIIPQRLQFEKIICSFSFPTRAMFFRTPADDSLKVFLHGSGAANQHHYGLNLTPQGPEDIKAIPIIPNTGN